MTIDKYQQALINYIQLHNPKKLKFNPKIIEITDRLIIFGLEKHAGRFSIKKEKLNL
jgi:hypothetical protein